MRKLSVFNHLSLDGYFVTGDGDFRWAQPGSDDAEYQAFVAENASGGGELLFGRVTYQLMAGCWPTPMAEKQHPSVAAGMNKMAKAVFSRTLSEVSWSNSKLVKGDLATEVRKMKSDSGSPIVILGSGSVVAQLAQERLIDEYQIMLDPVALGNGRTMFDGMKEELDLKLNKTRMFKNGKIFLSYEPA